jgi:hypothetical protein
MTAISETTSEPDDRHVLILQFVESAKCMGMCNLSAVDPISAESLQRRLDDYPYEFLLGLKELIEAEDDTSAGVLRHLELGRTPDLILDNLHYHRLLGSKDYLHASALVAAIGVIGEEYDHDVYLPFFMAHRHASPLVQKQCVALMEFIRAFNYRKPDGQWFKHKSANGHPLPLTFVGQKAGSTPMYTIKNSALVMLIVNNPDRVDYIIDTVKEHGVDPASIEFVLNGGNSHLSDGAL